MGRGLIFGLFFIVIGLFLVSLSFMVAQTNDNNQTTNDGNETNNKTINQTCMEDDGCSEGYDCEDSLCVLDEKDKDEYDDNETDDEECEAWKCTKWNECVNHTQTRTCTENTACNKTDEKEEKPKESKTCKKLRHILKHNIKTEECSEECVCTGSTIKCELASGRIMTVHAGNSGNVIVQIKGVNMTTSVTLYKNKDGTLEGVFKGNKTKIIKILPDEVKEKIKQRIKAKLENEEIELDEDAIYHFKANKKARLLFLIPIKEKVEVRIDSETGDIIKTKTTWWGFLARDIREES